MMPCWSCCDDDDDAEKSEGEVHCSAPTRSAVPPTDSLDPVSCFVGRLSILREGTADGEPAAATAAFDNRPDPVVLVVGRRDAYHDRDRLGARVGAAGGGLGGNLVTQQFVLMAGGRHGETGIG